MHQTLYTHHLHLIICTHWHYQHMLASPNSALVLNLPQAEICLDVAYATLTLLLTYWLWPSKPPSPIILHVWVKSLIVLPWPPLLPITSMPSTLRLFLLASFLDLAISFLSSGTSVKGSAMLCFTIYQLRFEQSAIFIFFCRVAKALV